MPFYSAVNLDKDWVRQTFMLSSDRLADAAQMWRVYTDASQKFSSTRLGCNLPINNLPQYTRFADIRNSGKLSENQSDGRGMGRFYSEQIDDNNQVVTMRFGVPEYNGMLTFFTGFYDQEASLLAREGRASFFYYLGKAAGFVVSLRFWKFIAIGYVARFVLGDPSSKYYYMRSSMGTYWNRVNFITNSLAVNLGLVPRLELPLVDEDKRVSGSGEAVRDTATDGQYRSYAHKAMPDVFKENGGVDMYHVANKYQRLANKRMEYIESVMEGGGNQSLQGFRDDLSKFMNEWRLNDPGSKGLEEYLKMHHNIKMGSVEGARAEAVKATIAGDVSQAGGTGGTSDASTSGGEVPAGTATASETEVKAALEKGMRDKWIKKDETTWERFKGWWSELGDSMIADIGDGSQFVNFRVDYTGTVSESFSNSVKESDIQSKFNGISSSSKNARFSFSDGNTGIGVVDSVMGAVKDFATGVLDGVQMSGLLALAGSAFVDIPKHWDSSSAQFPSSSFTIELRTPYGHPISRFMNLYVPLAMLLAAALPASTGRQSYTSPFLCEMYNRGRNQIRLGMIDSLSITRGTGNMGWTKDCEMLGIDISFSVVDMSSVMHAPVDAGYSWTAPWKGIFDDDSAFSDYMATLGNLSTADQVYQLRKLAINITNKWENTKSFFSRSHFSNSFGNALPGRIIGSVIRDAENLM